MNSLARRFACPYVLLVVAFVFGTVGRAEPPRLRTVTYNIRHGVGMDGRLDLARTAAVIKGLRPDVVAIQEVDNKTRRSGKVDQAAELGRLTEMHSAFGCAMDFDGGQYGVAILARSPLAEVQNYVLSDASGREPRAALAARISLADDASADDQSAPARRAALRARIFGKADNPPVLVVCTHLEHRDEDLRMKQIETLKSVFIPDGTMPALLLGDLNSEPGSRPMLVLLRSWTDVSARSAEKTFPADRPASRLDYVLFRPTTAWRVVEQQVVDEPVASDHRPLLVVLELIRLKKD